MVSSLLTGLEDMQTVRRRSGAIRRCRAACSPPSPAARRPAPGVKRRLSRFRPRLIRGFSVALAGAEFASVYLVRAVNTGPVTDTFRFFATVAAGGINLQDP